ncbi:unnamed protein product [Ascophyllum nodosum]
MFSGKADTGGMEASCILEHQSPVPRQPGCSFSMFRLNLVLPYGIPPDFRGVSRHTPPGQSRVYPVTQLRTDGVHCRDSAGTRPVNLKFSRRRGWRGGGIIYQTQGRPGRYRAV